MRQFKTYITVQKYSRYVWPLKSINFIVVDFMVIYIKIKKQNANILYFLFLVFCTALALDQHQIEMKIRLFGRRDVVRRLGISARFSNP